MLDMKSIVLFMNSFVFSMACVADNLKDTVAGKVELAKLRSTNWFQLPKTYECELKLILGRKDTNHDESLERVFNCFSYDGSEFSEPDAPCPELNTVFYCTPMKGENIGVLDMAFFDSDADEATHQLKGVKNMKELLKLIPNMVCRWCEGDDEDIEEYWYSWVQLGEDEKLTVYYLEVSTEGEEFGLWLYKGICRVKE